MSESYVYILASKPNGTLYIGVTSDLIKRVWQHKQHLCVGFTARYKVTNLVYYEVYGDIVDAIEREKVLKKWQRKWKIDLIESVNSEWEDIFSSII